MNAEARTETPVDPFRPPQKYPGPMLQMISNIPIPIEVFETDGTLTFINGAALRAFGIPSAEVIVRHNIQCEQTILEDSGLWEVISRAFAGEAASAPEVLYDGIRIYGGHMTALAPVKASHCDMFFYPVRDETAQTEYVVCVLVIKKAYKGQEDIVRAMAYMDSHYLEDFNLSAVADVARLSVYHFARLFKKHMGITPQQYHINTRMDKVAEMLTEAEISVGEAFALCGMKYSGHYANVFRQRFTISPSEMRKRTQKKQYRNYFEQYRY